MSIKADIFVIGLGAMGAAITYQLARRGAKVIGIDQFEPPHNHGSTHGETRITRQAIGEGLQFVPLASRSHQLWREIEAASGEKIFTDCGALVLARTGLDSKLHGQSDFLGATIEAAESFGIKHEKLTNEEISARFPQFELIGDEQGYFEGEAGYLNPETAVAAQLKLAENEGATLITGQPAKFRKDSRATYVEFDGEVYVAEKTIIAAGAWVPQLLPEMAPNLRVSRQVLYWFELDGSVSYSAKECPVFIWNWGGEDTDVFYGFPQTADRAEIKIATEQLVTTTTPETVSRQVKNEEVVTMAESHVVGKLRGVTSHCTRAVTCLYTSTADSNFVIDWLPDRSETLVVSACSGHGFKHSAAIGEAAAEMVETGRTPEVLLPFTLVGD
jgi:sarcosine oxidase